MTTKKMIRKVEKVVRFDKDTGMLVDRVPDPVVEINRLSHKEYMG